MVADVAATAGERTGAFTADDVRRWLDAVPDPEIPVLSVNDLGIVRDIAVAGDTVTVAVAPTYTGCPAMRVIERSIAAELRRRGVAAVHVRRVLSPPWTTEWLSAAGRDKLAAYGIAPPTHRAAVRCPRCGSAETTRVSEFGATPCKAAFRCDVCREPFEYFKCL